MKNEVVADSNAVIVHFSSDTVTGKRGFRIEFSTSDRIGEFAFSSGKMI